MSHRPISKFAAVVFAIAVPLSAKAQTTPTPDAAPGCYSIASPTAGVQPFSYIMINRCTGGTWLLTRMTLAAAVAGKSEVFTYVWSPLNVTTTEPSLSIASR